MRYSLDHIEEMADAANNAGAMAHAQVIATLAVADRIDRLIDTIDNAAMITSDATTKAALHVGGGG